MGNIPQLLEFLAGPDILSLTEDILSLFFEPNTEISLLSEIDDVVKFLLVSLPKQNRSVQAYDETILINIQLLS